ncbi:MAG: Hpt domain-containing protein, partial [Pseudobdellovibrionaceae bacterium]|nr:Hpt domain-containing protein [Pseudobdellovibrionaceae bacterium]
MLEVIRASLGESIFTFEINLGQLPHEVCYHSPHGRTHEIELNWTAILGSDDQVARIMLTIVDNTEFAQAQKNAEQESLSRNTLGEMMLQKSQRIHTFLASCGWLNEGMPFENSARLAIDVYQKTFRRLHTAKGSARSLGFEELAQSIHELESALLLLLKEPKDFTPEAALAFSESWEDTRSVFGVYLRNYQMLCGYAAEGMQQAGTPAAPTKFNFQTFCLDLIPMIARTALDLKKPLPHLRLLCHT